MRTRLLVIGALVIALGVFAAVAARSAADPITVIHGKYGAVSPTGFGIHDVVFTKGTWGYINTTGTVSDLEVKSAGDFPLIDVTDRSGNALIGLLVPDDPRQMAIFDLPTLGRTWVYNPSGSFLLPVVLESNTVRGVDLSPFEHGGILSFSTTGVTIDAETNTATVSDTATATFTITAAIPEPSAALLAIVGGSLGLLWLWHTRRRHVAA